MKLNLKAILIAAVAALVSASCAKESLELRRPGLENVDATKVELTTLVSSDAARVRPFYVYELKLSDAEATIVLDAKFVSDGQPLHAAVYTPASFADAHKNTYLTGENGTTVTVTDATGQVRTGQVVSGNIEVTEEAGAYTVSGVVEVSFPATAEGGVPYSFYYDLSWSAEPVAVKFKELPTLTKLTKVLSAQSNVANGTNTVTVQLSSDGWESSFSMETYQTTYTGKGAYLAVDFYSADGYLAEGTYTASADPKTPQAGEFVIGYDTTMDFGWGPMEMKDWGTCWWTVDNAAPVAEKILSGEIFVKFDKKSKKYTVDIDNGTQYAQFVGEIPALTQPDKPAGGEQDEVLNADIVIEKSVPTLNKVDDTANNTSADQSPLSGVTLWYVELLDASGEKAAIFDLVTEEGSESLAGEYKITSYPDEAGEAGNGFDLNFPDWGLVMSGGTILYDNGNTYVLDADTGTVTVQEKDGAYKIVVKGTTTGADGATKTIAARYIVGEWKNEGGAAFDGQILTLVSAAEQYDQYKQAVLQFATDGVSATMDPTTYQTTYSGTGKIINLTIHAEKGNNGVYVPVGSYAAAEGTTDPFTWQVTGGMPEYNFYWGTLMYDVVDGAPTMVELTDGTVDVDCDGENYTITMVFGGENFRYTGPLGSLAPAE